MNYANIIGIILFSIFLFLMETKKKRYKTIGFIGLTICFIGFFINMYLKGRLFI